MVRLWCAFRRQRHSELSNSCRPRGAATAGTGHSNAVEHCSSAGSTLALQYPQSGAALALQERRESNQGAAAVATQGEHLLGAGCRRRQLSGLAEPRPSPAQ